MSLFRYKSLLFASTLSVVIACTGASFAAPVVDGTTISWPAGDWYQVQRAENYQSICNGGLSCVVDDGKYVVINHSTSERFDVEVKSFATPLATITVDNRTISWPDDGWYQVQRADTYESVCSGGRECTVEPGKYFVINHSTGDRNEVLIPESTIPLLPSQSAIDVSSDNVISWPDNGWYEVQSASTYESICAGGRSCAVANGIYNVINHSNGERFDGIVVSGEAPPTNASSPELTVEVPKAYSLTPDGSWGNGRSSPWERYAQWRSKSGDWLYIDSQLQGPQIGESQSTAVSNGAQWAASYSDSHLQIVILGSNDGTYPSASIFLDGNFSRGTQYDGVDDYHFIIPVNNRSGNFWENNRSVDSDGYFYFGDQSAIISSNAIQFATCTCGGSNMLWEINIDLAAANIPLNKAFGFDVRLDWKDREDFTFGWADDSNLSYAFPAQMGTMILISD